jgi:hypothetical protein
MKDRWTELCEQAVTELDSNKFRAILRELNQLLDERGCPPHARSAQLGPGVRHRETRLGFSDSH